MRILALKDFYKVTLDNALSPPMRRGFQIELNDMHLNDYKHRIPLDRVRTLYIWGNVNLDYIEFQV